MPTFLLLGPQLQLPWTIQSNCSQGLSEHWYNFISTPYEDKQNPFSKRGFKLKAMMMDKVHITGDSILLGHNMCSLVNSYWISCSGESCLRRDESATQRALQPFEMSVNIYQWSWHNILEESYTTPLSETKISHSDKRSKTLCCSH